MSVVFNSLPFTNKEGHYRPLTKNSSNIKIKNPKQLTVRRNSRADCKITIEGWSQTPNSESLLFLNDEDKSISPRKQYQITENVHLNVFKNALSNLSESLALMQKKSLTEEDRSSKKSKNNMQKGLKLNQPAQNLEKLNIEDNTNRTKTSQEFYYKKSQLDQNRHTFRRLDHQRWLSKRYLSTQQMEQIEESTSMRKDSERTEKIEKTGKSITSWRVSIKLKTSPRNNNTLQSDQNRSNFGVAPVKQTVHTLNFQTKLSASQLANLERFQIFSRPRPKEIYTKSARGSSAGSFEKECDVTVKELGQEKFETCTQPTCSPNSKGVPHINLQTIRKSKNLLSVFPFNTEAGLQSSSKKIRKNWKGIHDNGIMSERNTSFRFNHNTKNELISLGDSYRSYNERNQFSSAQSNTFEVSKIQLGSKNTKDKNKVLISPFSIAKTLRDRSTSNQAFQNSSRCLTTHNWSNQNLFKNAPHSSRSQNKHPDIKGLGEMLRFISVSSRKGKRK